MDIEKHLALSRKIEMEDLDWAEAARVGLTPAEAKVLTYFADVEAQTVFYMLEVLKLKTARDPDTLAFATIWNYEEYFHSYAIMKLLDACGLPADRNRVTRVRTHARLKARLEDFGQTLLSKLFPEAFVALWMAWGASQEAMTLSGYVQISATTANPVLKAIVDRIAKQERRHFAWYYQAARDHLGRSRFSQRLVRFIFERFWAPVGGGVKTPAEVNDLVRDLFPPDALASAMASIDEKMARLPGLDGFTVMADWAARVNRELTTGAEPAVSGG